MVWENLQFLVINFVITLKICRFQPAESFLEQNGRRLAQPYFSFVNTMPGVNGKCRQSLIRAKSPFSADDIHQPQWKKARSRGHFFDQMGLELCPAGGVGHGDDGVAALHDMIDLGVENPGAVLFA